MTTPGNGGQWDGMERRADHLEFDAAVASIRDLRESVVNLAAVATTLAPRSEVTAQVDDVRAEAAMWTKRFLVLVGINAVAAVMTLGSLLQHRDQASVRVNDSLLCVLEQLTEHRDANERAHTMIAPGYAAPDNETPLKVPIELRAKCRKFLPEGGAQP